MTRNFVPLHVFLRHESEWQSVRETTGNRETAELPQKPPVGADAYGESHGAKPGLSSASHAG